MGKLNIEEKHETHEFDVYMNSLTITLQNIS